MSRKQFLFYCDPDLLAWVKKQAKTEGRSAANYIERVLQQRMNRAKQGKGNK